MNGKELSENLRAGKRVYGTCITAALPHWTGIAASAGLDFVFIDTEHVPLGPNVIVVGMPGVPRTGDSSHCPHPRPGSISSMHCTRRRRRGYCGPLCGNRRTGAATSWATKLRPLKGRRLANVLRGAETLEDELDRYITQRNAGNVLAINIESRPALEALDDILSVPGLDAILIGPHDLSCSLAVPEQYGHPAFNAAVSEIISKARSRHVGVGLHYSRTPSARSGGPKKAPTSSCTAATEPPRAARCATNSTCCETQSTARRQRRNGAHPGDGHDCRSPERD